MANLISRGSIGLVAASAWNAADINPQADHAASTATSLSDVPNGTAFGLTNGATLSGVLMFCKMNTVTGTVTVKLKKSGAQVAICTVNVVDLPAYPGWTFFTFSSPYLVDTASAVYTVTIVSSSNASAQFYRSSTAANWTRLFATDTTATAGAGDVLYCVGDLTGAGTGNDFTTTANDTTGANAYGGIEVGHRGILSQLTVGTQYYLSITGNFFGWGGSTITFGDATHGITMTITINCASLIQYFIGFNDGCTFSFQGVTKTGSAFLAANAVPTDTALTRHCRLSYRRRP